MIIKEITEYQNCDTNNYKVSIFFANNVEKHDMIQLAADNELIFNENFPLPYFKIITSQYIIRGSLDTNRITIDFNSSIKQECENIVKKLIINNIY